MAGDLETFTIASHHEVWRHKFAEPWGREIAHIRRRVFLLGEETDVSLREVHRERLTVLGQNADALTQQLNLALILNLETHLPAYFWLFV